jgi:hypothetical protein
LYRTLGLQLLDPVPDRVEARLQPSGGGGEICPLAATLELPAELLFLPRAHALVQVSAGPVASTAVDGDASRSEGSSHREPVPSSVDDSADHGVRMPLVVPSMRKNAAERPDSGRNSAESL